MNETTRLKICAFLALAFRHMGESRENDEETIKTVWFNVNIFGMVRRREIQLSDE